MFGVFVKVATLFNVGVCFVVYITSEIEATGNKGYQFLALGNLAVLAVITHRLYWRVIYRQHHAGLWVISWPVRSQQGGGLFVPP